MHNIFPSIEMELPVSWSLLTENGGVQCHQPHLWIQCKNLISDSGFGKNTDIPLNQLEGVLLRFQGPYSLWLQIKSQQLIGYSPQREGAVLGGSFDRERTFYFEAALCSQQLTLLSLMNYSSLQLKNQFIQGTLSDELQNANNYRLISVTQSVPNIPQVQIGLTMDWSKG
jgi:hypothetical protein